MQNNNQQVDHSRRDLDILTVIGAFLAVFGFAVLAAVFYTPTYHGKIVNIFSGGIILLIGLAAIFKGRMRRPKK